MIQGNAIRLAPAGVVAPTEQTFTERLRNLWEEGKAQDKDFDRLVSAVRQGDRVFPADLVLPVKVLVSDCVLDDNGYLRFRGRLWVPDYEPLRTAIIQELHNSALTGHPGKNGTIAVVSRDFFWPNLQTTVKQFVRNCGICGRTKVWRDRKHGLLRPLPVPEQQ